MDSIELIKKLKVLKSGIKNMTTVKQFLVNVKQNHVDLIIDEKIYQLSRSQAEALQAIIYKQLFNKK